jgi:RimJ/RimL family protein N-acetyltransferase
MASGEEPLTDTIDCGGVEVRLAPFDPACRSAVEAFAADLAPHDLLFLSRNIQHPKVVEAWLHSIADGEIESLIAFDGDAVVGTTAIVRDPHSWSAHVADIRLLIAASMRGKGLGRALLERAIRRAVELGATKLTARMTPDQRGAITLFEEAGFRGEALLRDHVRGPDGRLHDLAILSLDVARHAGQHAMTGVDNAF